MGESSVKVRVGETGSHTSATHTPQQLNFTPVAPTPPLDTLSAIVPSPTGARPTGPPRVGCFPRRNSQQWDGRGGRARTAGSSAAVPGWKGGFHGRDVRSQEWAQGRSFWVAARQLLSENVCGCRAREGLCYGEQGRIGPPVTGVARAALRQNRPPCLSLPPASPPC